MSTKEKAGNWFVRQRERSTAWMVLFCVFLAALLAANFFLHPLPGGGHGGGHGEAAVLEAPAEADVHEPAHGDYKGPGIEEHITEAGKIGPGHGFWDPPSAHFGYDWIPGFFAAFGLIGGIFMVMVMKKAVQPVIEVEEDPDDVL